ncbi:tyrosine-protein phosphatase [Paenibacillus aceris]|uniref:Tyrosine-protein phosphatase n=1 Tax=Paenibacillus aceris TaxID=869555 RepID=A0ABS4HUM5_9BACL|nr:CpsB/CapC family capsule biosynthesis tyrosine phosphatase [Paenibacillus aceris]MBP1962320.1 protein-tyrosine phosphatase [Paenibacillus aceris]NHW37143.1 tyrosine protein phosphatase [Paenibacillus aceris]
MIDIHSHILPDIDDGSDDLEQSILMAREAVVQGIHSVIATPHHENGRFTNDARFVESQVKAFQEELQQRNIPLRIYAGQEIRVYRNLVEDIEAKRTSTLNGSRYMLLEFPSDRISSGIHELLHELRLMNIVPIIAHPERNREIVQNPEKLLELVQLGALSQITAHSIIGHFGKSIQTLSIHLCRNHLAHFVSSDAHNTTNRGFALAGAYHILQEKLGIDTVNTFQNNANSIIHDTEIESYQPVWAKPKWFQFWKSNI